MARPTDDPPDCDHRPRALRAAPTWTDDRTAALRLRGSRRATSTNIARTTPIASACANFHGADYAKFWLTDAIDNAYGWIPASATWEDTANAGVTFGAQLPTAYTP